MSKIPSLTKYKEWNIGQWMLVTGIVVGVMGMLGVLWGKFGACLPCVFGAFTSIVDNIIVHGIWPWEYM